MAKYYGAAAQGKKGRPECPTATQVRSLAQVHFWLPSSLSSIRFPCLPACLPACLQQRNPDAAAAVEDDDHDDGLLPVVVV